MHTFKLTKEIIVIIIASIIGIIVAGWAILAVHNENTKKEEVKTIETIPQTVEVIEETEPERPDDIPEPVMTEQEFKYNTYLVNKDNINRYDINELNNIIQSVVSGQDGVNLELKRDNDLSAAKLDNSIFEDILTVWYPDKAVVIMLAKLDINNIGTLTSGMRDFLDLWARSSSDNYKKDLFSHYEHTSYNGYIMYAVCDNADVLIDKIIEYMKSIDSEVVDEYTSQFETNEWGVYYKDAEDDSNAENAENTEIEAEAAVNADNAINDAENGIDEENLVENENIDSTEESEIAQ